MRSEFLTLLCVLTFLSCAWGLFDATVSFWKTDAVAETPLLPRKLTQEEKAVEPKAYFEDRASGDGPMPGDAEQIRLLAIAQFGYSFLTLIGAGLMFTLRRVGFWVYVVGTVFGIVVPVTLAGFGALNVSFGVFFSVIFIGLYWLNLKNMR